MAVLLGAWLLTPIRAGNSDEWLAGADISSLATMEQHGAIYREGRRPGDALEILRGQGLNCFRLRLFVAPDGKDVVTNDLAYTLALAKRVKATGAKLLLDIHYSDTWADPAKQFKPAAWADLAFPDLVARVQTYTTATLQAFVREGAAPDFVQLGNEITNGLLWPDGRVEYATRDEATGWSRLGELLRVAHAGLAAAFPAGGRPRSILHIESPHQLERALWFCREATAARVPFDMIGVSYYPEWHEGLPQLRRALDELARTFGKPLLVVETAYPWKNDEHWQGRPHLTWPLTPAGQKRFMRDVVDAVRATSGGLGVGVVYWNPEGVPVRDLGVWVGGSCSLFGDSGRVLPAAAELARRR
ncbi:MAG: glycosyl hydrolase 53 family protein [Opitutaceae bacterium]